MSLQFVTRVASRGADSWRAAGPVCFDKPGAALLPALYDLLEKCESKCNGYVALRLDTPHRPRSTGWKSQNHHIRGHARQLCDYTGFTMREMMDVIKEECPNWPVEYREFRGKRRAVYASEADISVEVASEAIEICHRIAADNGWTLKEVEE